MTTPTPDPTDADRAKAVDLDRLEKALAAGEPRPWVQMLAFDSGQTVVGSNGEEVATHLASADAAAIVAAVNSASALIAELRDLRAQRDAVRELARELGAHTIEPTSLRDEGFIAGVRYASRLIPLILDGSGS